jgi:uncharacterized protein (TIGR02145 family)
MKKLLDTFLIILMVLFISCEKEQLIKELGVFDIDGNRYDTVSIGNQVWLKQNLMTKTYNDGTPITCITDFNQWVQLDIPAYCYIYNDTTYAKYGILYNWYVINEGDICPNGWRVPSDDDFKILERYIGMTDEVDNIGWRGNKANDLKAKWSWETEDNTSDLYHFSVLATGFRSYLEGYFFGLGTDAMFWTSDYGKTEELNGIMIEEAQFRSIVDYKNGIFRGISPCHSGAAIRCLKDK